MKAAPNWVDDVLAFWFSELEPQQWFTKSDETDAMITHRFAAQHHELSGAVIEDLTVDARTALAAIVVLDQFPRNMFRGSPRSFASDAKALGLAKLMVERGLDQELPDRERVFVYLPYEHSEDLADQDASVALISCLGDERYTKFAEDHRKVIREFGRFPHRNVILGRVSTPDEAAFLAKPGSSF